MFTLPLTPHANSLGNKGFSETRSRLILRGRDSVSLAAKSSPRAVIPGQFTSAGLPVPSSLWAMPSWGPYDLVGLTAAHVISIIIPEFNSELLGTLKIV